MRTDDAKRPVTLVTLSAESAVWGCTAVTWILIGGLIPWLSSAHPPCYVILSAAQSC